MSRSISVVALLCCFTLFFLTSNVFADDGSWGDPNAPLDIDWVGDSETLDLDHEDGDDWKGWATVWVANICGEDWGDFHFQIKSIFGSNIENVSFREDYAPQMWIRTAPFTWEQVQDIGWEVDNDTVGATLDMEFYDNPIEAGDWAMFKVYTDNTVDKCSWFRISANPTPVPEPTTIALLGMGAVALLRRRK